jgi:hypothetical protein
MTHIAASHGTRIPLVSTCPTCGNEQAQWYLHPALSRLLLRGHPVEGYCVVCQEHWQLDRQERNALAARLAGVRPAEITEPVAPALEETDPPD